MFLKSIFLKVVFWSAKGQRQNTGHFPAISTDSIVIIYSTVQKEVVF